jgi:excisionase family DNA binding protein
MPITIKNETYYKTVELAKLVGVTVETINEWRKNKGLVAHKISQRKFIFSATEIEKFLKGN